MLGRILVRLGTARALLKPRNQLALENWSCWLSRYQRIVSETDARSRWRELRQRMESGHRKYTPVGIRPLRYWPLFDSLVHVAGLGLRVVGLYSRGFANALDVRVHEMEVRFSNLPPAFDGYRIMQLTDLHVDHVPGTTVAAIRQAGNTSVDLCLLTGDYRHAFKGPFEQILGPLQSLVESVNAPDGVYAVLGNHDCAAMVESLENLGMRVLLNESVLITRNTDHIVLTGLDDVHYFYTEAALGALDRSPPGFKIALVHSAEVADLAAKAGYALYVGGHTHGGQICLPGGRPVFTHLHRCRGFAAGRWSCGPMQGYTSNGTGVSAIPMRFNCPPEVAVITLRRED